MNEEEVYSPEEQIKDLQRYNIELRQNYEERLSKITSQNTQLERGILKVIRMLGESEIICGEKL